MSSLLRDSAKPSPLLILAWFVLIHAVVRLLSNNSGEPGRVQRRGIQLDEVLDGQWLCRQEGRRYWGMYLGYGCPLYPIDISES